MTKYGCTTPVVMSFSNHDPSGSAGIQADIETTASLGCHNTPIITALCAKDTQEIKDIIPVDSSVLIEQARAILEDMPVRAVKIGFLGSVENAEAVHSILRDYPDIPVVLTPVTNMCNNELLNAPAIINAIQTLLLPLTTVATPDLVESHDLAQQADNIDACAQEILETGCEYVLISGTRRTHEHYENSLYSSQGLMKHYTHERLKLFSHGCGATLATSIAAYIAHGIRLMDAIEQGQKFTWQALADSRRLGMGMRIPNRFYWTSKNEKSLSFS